MQGNWIMAFYIRKTFERRDSSIELKNSLNERKNVNWIIVWERRCI